MENLNYTIKTNEEIKESLLKSLLQLCEPHTLKITKRFYKINSNGDKELISEEITEKEIDPDLKALKTLLKNYSDFSENPTELELKKDRLKWQMKVESEEKGILIEDNLFSIFQ